MWKGVASKPIPKFNLYRADFDKLNNLLSSVDWEGALTDLDINDAWNHFSGTLDIYIKECISMSVPRIKRKLYITREAKALKNKRNRLWKRYTSRGSQSAADHLAYTQARNALRSLTRNLRKQFERQIAQIQIITTIFFYSEDLYYLCSFTRHLIT